MRSLPFSDRNLGQYLPYNTNRIKEQSAEEIIYSYIIKKMAEMFRYDRLEVIRHFFSYGVVKNRNEITSAVKNVKDCEQF